MASCLIILFVLVWSAEFNDGIRFVLSVVGAGTVSFATLLFFVVVFAWLAQPDEPESDEFATSKAISEDRIYEDDEIVRHNTYFHMERMDEKHIWFSIGEEHNFDLYASKGGKLTWIPQTIDGSWETIRDEEVNE